MFSQFNSVVNQRSCYPVTGDKVRIELFSPPWINSAWVITLIHIWSACLLNTSGSSTGRLFNTKKTMFVSSMYFSIKRILSRVELEITWETWSSRQSDGLSTIIFEDRPNIHIILPKCYIPMAYSINPVTSIVLCYSWRSAVEPIPIKNPEGEPLR